MARRIRDQVTKREAPPLGSPLSAHERAEIAAQVEAALVAEIAAAQAEADRLVTTA